MGRLLLWDALNRCVAATDANSVGIGIYAVIVDAIDDAAVEFYRRYGFEPFVENPLQLFLPLSTIRQARG